MGFIFRIMGFFLLFLSTGTFAEDLVCPPASTLIFNVNPPPSILEELIPGSLYTYKYQLQSMGNWQVVKEANTIPFISNLVLKNHYFFAGRKFRCEYTDAMNSGIYIGLYQTTALFVSPSDYWTLPPLGSSIWMEHIKIPRHS